MTGDFLSQILILLAGSLLVLSLVRRFALPPILGYLVVGMLLGPHALGLATDDETVRLLAEIGVVFLVFTLGLEFSFARMVAMKSEVLGVGGLQMLLTTGVFGAIAWGLGIDFAPAVVIGGALAMSSTAIVLRQLGDQLEINRVHARMAVGILLFQDLAFVPFLAIATSIGQGDPMLNPNWLLGMVGRAVIALLVVLAAGRWLLRPLFHEIARHRSTETFTLTVLFVVLGSAWATHALGLSMALGAFLAGLLLADSEYRHELESQIEPFKGLLLGLFFISVGMGANLGLLLSLPLMLGIAIAIRLDSPGPVFFTQERVGENGRVFRVFKLRSMVLDAEERRRDVVDLDQLPEPAYKLPDDPRITRVGRWLRRYSLDELPQFVNVLRGEMSLVGPRPEEVALVARYNDWQRRRLAVKPGMSGPMQVNGRGRLSLTERVALEVDYIEHYSLRRDVGILVRTLPAVLRGDGSY